MSVIGIKRVQEILAVRLDALPDLFDLAADAADTFTQQLAKQDFAAMSAGNASALLQQVAAAADLTVGWAPWQVDQVAALASFDTLLLAAGSMLADVLAPILTAAWKVIRDAVVAALRTVLEPFLDVLGAIPVAGQVIDIVFGFIMGIVRFVELAKVSQAASEAETAFAPTTPSPEADRTAVQAPGGMLDVVKTGDWTRIWLPYADIADRDDAWKAPFSCTLLVEPHGGRRIGPLSDHAWGVECPAESASCYGFGNIPGTGNAHGVLEVLPRGRGLFDTRQGFAMMRAGALQAWSLLWADGPSCFTVDPDQVAVSWTRYVGELLEQLDGRSLPCGPAKLSKAATLLARRRVASMVGAPQDASPDDVVSRMAPVVTMRALSERQKVMLQRTTIAYVDAAHVPEQLRARVEQAQADLLTSDEVCRIDLERVPNAVYRLTLEAERRRRGVQCFAASNILAFAKRSEPLGPGVPDLPPVPAPPDVPPLDQTAERAKPSSSKSSAGGAVALGLGLVLALALTR